MAVNCCALVGSVLICCALSGCGLVSRTTNWRPLEVVAPILPDGSARTAYRFDANAPAPSGQSVSLATLTAEAAAGTRDGQTLSALAEAAYASASQHEAAGRDSCVDDYLLTAACCWQALFAAPGECVAATPSGKSTQRLTTLYNASVGKCIEAAQRFHRFDGPGAIRVETPRGPARVTVAYHGLAFPAEQIERWVAVGDYEAEELTRRYRRPGMGAPLVGLRHRVPAQPTEQFMPERLPLAATAVLRPNLDAMLGGARLGDAAQPADVAELELFDTTKVATALVNGRPIKLASDLSAPWALALLDPDRSRVELGGFFRPEQTADATGLFMLEPYQAGKIPVVMVHGLISGPWTWTDVINELRADPLLRERYQLWVYRYPTGGPLLHAAARLRCELNAARAAVDPSPRDAALDHMVLLGYSLGGLIAKLQISHGGDELWSHYATRPLDSLRLSEVDRRRLCDWFYFQPAPYVARVVCFATPHRGTRTRNQYVGRLASSFVRLPEASEMAERIVAANPGAFRVSADRLLATNVDLLTAEDTLSAAMRRLPIRRDAILHSVIGQGEQLWGGEDSDGVVTVASARLDGAASECLVPAEHSLVHRHPQSITEIKRILCEHLATGG